LFDKKNKLANANRTKAKVYPSVLCCNRAASPECGGDFLKTPMIMGFSYHSRSFLKTEFDETAEAKNAVAKRRRARAGG
jgi:hypothetical protein